VIYFLLPARGREHVEEFLDGPGRVLRSRLELMSHQVAYNAPARPGTYVFAGVQQLSDAGRARVADLWLRLSRLGSAVRLLNNPLEVVGRYELLQTLHSTGLNAFNARRLSEPEPPLRFPVFIRHDRGHEGPLTRLLRDQRELDEASAMLKLLDDDGNLLVVEFCDTSDDEGVFRKYGVFMVGDRVIPRYVFFSREWVVKIPDLVDVREEHEFLETNPHEDWVREVFRVAGVDYGRVDYSVLNGRPQAWEINTNPGIWSRPASEDRVADQERVGRRLVAAFEELDRRAVGGALPRR
jgi:hypothetical protein